MSDKVRVYEIADEAGANSNEVISKAKEMGIELKSPQSAVSLEQAEAIVNQMMSRAKAPSKNNTSAKSKKTVSPKQSEEPKAAEETNKEEKQTETKEDESKSKAVQKEEVIKQEEKEEKKSAEDTKKPVNTQKEEKTNNNRIIPKRRGLKIVKKKKPVNNHKIEDDIKSSATSDSSKHKMKSLSEILGGSNEDEKVSTAKPSTSVQTKPKVKKEKKKIPPKAHTHGKKLELDKEFADSDDSLLGEEVVLLDMGVSDESKLFQDQKNNNNNNNNSSQKHSRSSKPAAFGNRPQGLKRKKRKKRIKRVEETKEITEVTIPEDIRVYEFAEACGKSPAEVITVLFGLGMMVTKNDFLKQDELEILGEEFEIEVHVKDALEDANYIEDYQEEEIDESNFITRPPIVTIMGHVDHGKTTLLDKIRSSKTAAGEAGGITQHIAAYTIKQNNNKITFVDTPGHAAFSAMRSRGANITDIVIIVVAADDGVKQQTEEVISHAKAAGGPIIVAVNKMDKEGANIDMVKAQMAERDMTPVDWGGDVEFIPVSAKTGEGIDDLLENILLQSEILELSADPEAKAKATVVEASLEKGRGPVATVIVQNGTLRVGDNIVCDTTYGRVKAITNDLGKQVKELGLSETGRVLGLNDVPISGTIMVAQDSDKEAKDIATTRAEHARAKELSKSTKVSLEEMSGLIAEGKIKQLPVILKADVSGSLEAIKSSLEEIHNDEVKVKVIHAGVGGVTESDLILASASEGCIILGFNVRPTGAVKNKAKADGITINTYSIIYDLIDDIKDTLSGMMSAIIREENTGQAEVRDTFVVPKVGTVAGCLVTDGKVIRGGHARIIRDGVVTYTGKISSLKRFKDDVKEVSNGYECGVMFEKFNDIKVGDFIETFIQIEEKAHIDD
ncbi:translation initiation factor IF-2 [Arcobacter sp. CECT 8985]|uniref:translation initiation factor IF-2 n=1 Tax=Arcobacter sp. CECT 8985 TaxID=1935424 RepID=UPI00100A2B56|nr:translation initiation factor IF-2 [Arcobacter sp. CECT 8985]RXJ87437.1 translation initiation factor IF-2 [Arcobacter sp. CECT 8985]